MDLRRGNKGIQKGSFVMEASAQLVSNLKMKLYVWAVCYRLLLLWTSGLIFAPNETVSSCLLISAVLCIHSQRKTKRSAGRLCREQMLRWKDEDAGRRRCVWTEESSEAHQSNIYTRWITKQLPRYQTPWKQTAVNNRGTRKRKLTPPAGSFTPPDVVDLFSVMLWHYSRLR